MGVAPSINNRFPSTIAAGMMCAASFALLGEGFELREDERSVITPRQGVLVGLAAGAAFGAGDAALSGHVHHGEIDGLTVGLSATIGATAWLGGASCGGAVEPASWDCLAAAAMARAAAAVTSRALVFS